MMMLRRRFLDIAPIAALAACSSPPAQYYRLAAMPGATLDTAAKSVRIRNISIPAYLNQNNIAKPSGAYQFAAYGNSLWAEPLADMLQSTLVENLTQRLPRMTVTGAAGVVGASSGLLVEINILRFDPDASGSIVLIAQIAIKTVPDGTFMLTKTIQSSASPATSDAGGTAAAMSALWAGLANEIAQYAAQ
jgi:uncharacterized lipoprotein YmbA